jgi:hypothetical protein
MRTQQLVQVERAALFGTECEASAIDERSVVVRLEAQSDSSSIEGGFIKASLVNHGILAQAGAVSLELLVPVGGQEDADRYRGEASVDSNSGAAVIQITRPGDLHRLVATLQLLLRKAVALGLVPDVEQMTAELADEREKLHREFAQLSAGR